MQALRHHTWPQHLDPTFPVLRLVSQGDVTNVSSLPAPLYPPSPVTSHYLDNARVQGPAAAGESQDWELNLYVNICLLVLTAWDKGGAEREGSVLGV